MLEAVLEKVASRASQGAIELIGRRIKKLNEDQERKSNLKKLDKFALLKELDKENRSAVAEVYYEEKTALINLISHVEFIRKWSEIISFKEQIRPKKLVNSYVSLDTYLVPKSLHVDPIEKQNKLELIKELKSANSHCILLGSPGAGKTTSIQKLCADCLAEGNKENFRYPLLIKFRSMNNFRSNSPLIESLGSIIGFSLKVNMVTLSEKTSLSMSLVAHILDLLNTNLFLDGFDEIPDKDDREKVLNEIQLLSRHLSTSKIIITCRSGEFPYSIDNTKTYEIAPLDENQISEFVNKWLKNNANKFLSQIAETPYYDTTIRPLTLAHLCAIYDRIGKIPDRPKTIYKKIVYMYLEDWDEQRRVRRESSYKKFDTDRKFEFLCYLAFSFTKKGLIGEFTETALQEVYNDVAPSFGLPSSRFDRRAVIGEIESHSGLFVISGYESYEFAHRSIQEYLSAEYIIKLPSLYSISSEFNRFVSELAIAAAISSNPSLFFTEFVLYSTNLPEDFYEHFINRLCIEKPDFVTSVDLLVAVLVVFEKLNNAVKTREQFLELSRSLFVKESVQSVLSYYRWPIFEPLKSNYTFQLHSNKNNCKFPRKISLSVHYQKFISSIEDKADYASKR